MPIVRNICAVFIAIIATNAYNILIVLPTTFKSHHQIGEELALELLSDGHHVTIVSPFKLNKSVSNYTEIILEHSLIGHDTEFREMTNTDFTTISTLGIVKMLIKIKTALSDWIKRSENYKQFLSSKAQFDVVVIESAFCEELFGLGQHFNAPIIILSATMSVAQMGSLTAIPALSSYMPNIFDGYSDQMNFFQRLRNMITTIVIDLAAEHIGASKVQKRYEDMFADDANKPSIKEIKQNISLMLMNSHPALTGARPLPHNIIEVGGMPFDPHNQVLSESLQRILDTATAGAVYFSLGSIVNVSRISANGNAAIKNAFRQFPKITFLIKSSDDLHSGFEDLENVYVQSWLPQRAILAHSNLKAFITHGGLNSIQESIYYGKPLIVVPFFFDQLTNGRMAFDRGYGLNIPFTELTEERLTEAIQEILYNPRYKAQAEITSEHFRDQIVSPRKLALHWVKHVAKNRGAPHLHSIAVEFPFYVYYNLDVWIFIFLIIFLTFMILKEVFTRIFQKCSSIL